MRTDNRFVCVKFPDGRIMRVERIHADSLVTSNKAKYTPKHKWKESKKAAQP